MFSVWETDSARVSVAQLRGGQTKSYDAFKADLRARGCAAMDYRMSGESVEHICVKHLRYDLRVLACFAGDEIWVLLVGPHSRSASENI